MGREWAVILPDWLFEECRGRGKYPTLFLISVPLGAIAKSFWWALLLPLLTRLLAISLIGTSIFFCREPESQGVAKSHLQVVRYQESYQPLLGMSKNNSHQFWNKLD